ncbi:methylase [Hapalosiphon sp. MRB220]|nr:methylase [Hapalosiphon sp. MRB220]
MVESNYPEINVDELMEKIRKEIAQSYHHSQPNKKTPLPKLSNNFMATLNFNLNHIESLLKNAEFRSALRTKWPDNLNKFPFNLSRKFQNFTLKILNFIFKDQREVNYNVIQALKESVSLNKQLIEQIKNLKTQIDGPLGSIDTRISEIEDKMDESLNTLSKNIASIDDRFNNIIEKLLHEHLSAINVRIANTNENLVNLDERLVNLDDYLENLNTRVHDLKEYYYRNYFYIKNDLLIQKRLITLFLEEAKKSLIQPLNQTNLQNFITEEQHLVDGFYVAFEDQFRGTREDIFNRLKVYLPFIEEAKIGTPDTSILDVGCGRGEWLELLQNHGYKARGIDINRVMLDQCRVRDLDVFESDVITYLQSLPDASLGAVTGFHIIEHLPFSILMKLLNETLRVLKPGGLAIFETPNPKNVLVGSHNFYTDPTHKNPLPISTISFMVEYTGFSEIKTLELHPYPEEYLLKEDTEVARRFNEHFYGAQDYSVIGKKPIV